MFDPLSIIHGNIYNMLLSRVYRFYTTPDAEITGSGKGGMETRLQTRDMGNKAQVGPRDR